MYLFSAPSSWFVADIEPINSIFVSANPIEFQTEAQILWKGSIHFNEVYGDMDWGDPKLKSLKNSKPGYNKDIFVFSEPEGLKNVYVRNLPLSPPTLFLFKLILCEDNRILRISKLCSLSLSDD